MHHLIEDFENSSVEGVRITFKANEVAYKMLGGEPGLRPAPYFASRGMKWIQRFAKSALSDDELRGYLRQSYALVGQGLPKNIRMKLRLGTS